MDCISPKPHTITVINKDTLYMWYLRLRYLSHQNIIWLIHMSEGINL